MKKPKPKIKPITPDTVRELLQQQVGQDQALRVKEIVEMLTNGRSSENLERTVRAAIEVLRMRGYEVCSHPNHGYWWARDVEELKLACGFLRSRAMTSLVQENRIKRAIPRLVGQLSLPLGLPEPGCEDFSPRDYTQQAQLSLIVELPEDLELLVKGYLERCTDWSQDDLFEAALAFFLSQQGVQGANNLYRRVTTKIARKQ